VTLTAKRQAFIVEYVKDFNATQAAIRAGYSERSARADGSRLLTNADIAQEIQRHIAERAMGADEVLSRLGDMARATFEDFVDIYDGVNYGLLLNFAKAQSRGKLHLIKKLKFNNLGLPEIELHDAQAALVQLARIHGLFKDKLEIEHSLTDRERVAKLMAIFAAHATGGSGSPALPDTDSE
jgi:phage terminase small subunit